ncbi:DNA replication/repair protein RecF [Evtepia sp.]|uniref:DNA replication/repair protein RecF n=1 Tax=Evtepia sp. TaxID=2773933 RepID=UPI002E75D2A7|nr:DNA replication/repair protein RecF [Evtepia sp.]MEE0256325.1 DNA replication/repair protein RecF [Evtepia sp.]
MKLRRIALDGFRNYTDFTADFSPGVNVIWGENAQGKTNLLEAIGFLSGARSHRARGDKELISFHRDRGTITAEVTSRGRDFLLEVQLFRGARRRLFVNHVKCKTAAELGGIVQTVLFCPEDLALIKAGAAERRSFLDHAICQLRPRYAEALAQYSKLLDHKTRILRDWEKHPSLLDVLEDFNEAMARAGALVIHYRAHFVRKLAEKAAQIQTEFSGGRETLALHYATVSTVRDPLGPTVELYEDLRRHQDSHAKAERDARSCLSGPHKDDLVARINGQPARQYASQGQTRTAALSLKLAERELFRDDTGQWPILLLDDVLSELDARRQDFVLRRITGGQVILTGCEAPDGSFPEGRTLHIVQGKLVNDPETGKIPVFQDKKDSDSSEPS